MKFFVARTAATPGNWSRPWSVWAEDYADAARKLSLQCPPPIAEMHIREKNQQSTWEFMGHHQSEAEFVVEHLNVIWEP